MANTKTLTDEQMLMVIEKYPKIVYVKSQDLILMVSGEKQKYLHTGEKIRIFFGDRNRSKLLYPQVVMQATRLEVHPIYVQHIHDLYGSLDFKLSDEFVERKLALIDMLKRRIESIKEKRTT